MPCVCGHPLGDHNTLGCNAPGEEDFFCPCELYEEAPPAEPDEDSYPERER